MQPKISQSRDRNNRNFPNVLSWITFWLSDGPWGLSAMTQNRIQARVFDLSDWSFFRANRKVADIFRHFICDGIIKFRIFPGLMEISSHHRFRISFALFVSEGRARRSRTVNHFTWFWGELHLLRTLGKICVIIYFKVSVGSIPRKCEMRSQLFENILGRGF